MRSHIFHSTENLLAIEIRKTQALMNNLVYLDWSMLDLSKYVMYECWYVYENQNMVKGKTSVYGYRQLHYSCKNKWYF